MLNRGDDYSNKEHCVTSIMELALQCSNESPEGRINMIEILARFKKIKEQFLIYLSPLLSLLCLIKKNALRFLISHLHFPFSCFPPDEPGLC